MTTTDAGSALDPRTPAGSHEPGEDAAAADLVAPTPDPVREPFPRPTAREPAHTPGEAAVPHPRAEHRADQQPLCANPAAAAAHVIRGRGGTTCH